jgi:flavodoxin
MKNLIVFYSRSGVTKQLAQKIAEKTGWEIIELADSQPRQGFSGYMKACWQALTGKQTEIQTFNNDFSDYDCVVVGTPIWAGNMAPAVRTFLKQYQDKIKQLAFFCTMGGANDQGLFGKIASAVNRQSKATMAIRTKQVLEDNYSSEINNFIEVINQ